jgi:hypothetical protein
LSGQPYCKKKDTTETANQQICNKITDQKLCVPKNNKCVWTGPQTPPSLSDMNMGFSMKF